MPSNQTPNTIHELKSLFDLLYPRLCHYADQLTGDSALAEKIAEAAFITYWKNKDDLPEDTDVKKYLYQQVTSACRKRIFYDEEREAGEYHPQKAWQRISGEAKVKGVPWGKVIALIIILILAALLQWWYTHH